MANTIRIKRRAVGGGSGPPTTLENAELAFNEQTSILYLGVGTGGGGGSATSIIPIGGAGSFVDVASAQTIGGVKTFTSPIVGSVSGSAGSTSSLTTGRSIAVTGDLAYTSGLFDGTANVTGVGTLPTVNSNVGVFTKITINAKGLATAGSQASLSDLSSPSASFSMSSQLLTNLLDPVSVQDAATKNYVDNVAQGLDPKASCLATTVANITLSGTQTIDGIAIVAGDRVLVKNQTLSANNGIYVASAGAWARSSDMDTWAEVVSAFTFIETGTAQADTSWVCTADAGGTLGVTPITWTQFGSAGSYTAGTGLTLTGSQFSITNTAITAATYGNINGTQTAVYTVNAQGQLTASATYDINVDGGFY